MRTIAIVNQKGGCGKTTTAINLAALYAKRGLRTLLVDMDPQSHCAAGLGVPETRIEYSIGDALVADHAMGFDPASLVWEVARNLHLAPSTMMLSALEAPGGGLHQLPDKDRRLENLLALISDKYDRCLIDCPPTIGLLTFNALRAAKEALIPVETGFFALRGAEKQWTTIHRMINHIGRPIACHLLPTLHNPQSQLACNILAALRRQFAGQIMPIVIHEDEALREAASLGQPVLEYAPNSKARSDFEALADWLEDHAANPFAQIEVLARGEAHGFNDCATTQNGTLNGPTGEEAAGIMNSSGRAGQSSGGGRAAELARRVHSLAAENLKRKTTDNPKAITHEPSLDELQFVTKPSSDPVLRVMERRVNSEAWEQTKNGSPSPMPTSHVDMPFASQRVPAPSPPQRDSMTHLFGVRQTSGGALFVQPGNLARTLSIAGDFNHWSPTANPLRYNEEVDVYETIINLPSGIYQYRLVADGEWIADSFNSQQQLNSYGEPNNVVVIT